MKTIRKTKLTNYSYIHQWNNDNHKKSGVCQHCDFRVEKTEWALIHGKEHCRSVDNYLELCRRCHVAYDRTPEWIEKNKQSLAKTYSHRNPIKSKSCEQCKNNFIPKRKTTRFCGNSCAAKWRFNNLPTNLIYG